MRARALLAAVLLAAAVGCGAATPAGEAVPALRTELSRVDTALAGQRYATARTALDALVRETVQARDSGRLTDEQASRILAAAGRLAAHLPSTPEPSLPPTPTTPVPAPAPEEKKDGDKKDKGDGDKKDEEDRGQDPDDGHGN